MRKLAIGIAIVLTVLVLYGGWNLLQSIAKVNEPDPAKVGPAAVAQFLKARGVDVEVDRVLYVYLDVTSYIFEGKINKIDKEKWESQFHRNQIVHFEGLPKGVIISKEVRGKTIIGYSDRPKSTPFEPHFGEKWKAFTE